MNQGFFHWTTSLSVVGDGFEPPSFLPKRNILPLDEPTIYKFSNQYVKELKQKTPNFLRFGVIFYNYMLLSKSHDFTEPINNIRGYQQLLNCDFTTWILCLLIRFILLYFNKYYKVSKSFCICQMFLKKILILVYYFFNCFFFFNCQSQS